MFVAQNVFGLTENILVVKKLYYLNLTCSYKILEVIKSFLINIQNQAYNTKHLLYSTTRTSKVFISEQKKYNNKHFFRLLFKYLVISKNNIT